MTEPTTPASYVLTEDDINNVADYVTSHDPRAMGIPNGSVAVLIAMLRQTQAELAPLRAELGEPIDPDDVFQVGHAYRSENDYFEFHCERRIGEYAIGIETLLKEWYLQPGMRFRKWATIGPSVGYRDVTEGCERRKAAADNDE